MQPNPLLRLQKKANYQLLMLNKPFRTFDCTSQVNQLNTYVRERFCLSIFNDWLQVDTNIGTMDTCIAFRQKLFKCTDGKW